MKIALVSTATAQAGSSMAAYERLLADALARHAPDIEVTIVSLGGRATDARFSQRLASLTLPLRAALGRGRAFDVWHVMDGSRAFLSLALPRDRLVITAHDIIPWLQARRRFPGAPPVGAAARWLWRRNGAAMRSARHLVCDSACTAQDVQREFGVDPARCSVVPLPVRPTLAILAADRSSAPSERPEGIVMHVGNDAFYKNRAQVLRVFARLDSDHPRRLVMVGPPPSADLEQLVHQYGMAPRVEWVVGVTDEELAAWYRRASVLLFPSVYEGYGWPVLEAMGFGVRVVASDRGSLPEVVGMDDTFVALDDEVGMADAVMDALRNPMMGREARRERAVACDAQTFARRMGDIYRRVATVAAKQRAA